MNAMKPCPFCGSEAVCFERHSEEVKYRVVCYECGCCTGWTKGLPIDMDLQVMRYAAKKWNRRERLTDSQVVYCRECKHNQNGICCKWSTDDTKYLIWENGYCSMAVSDDKET